MTLSEWSAAYVRLRADAVRAAVTGDIELYHKIGVVLRGLPSFHYQYESLKKE
jgi:hypothetical protein